MTKAIRRTFISVAAFAPLAMASLAQTTGKPVIVPAAPAPSTAPPPQPALTAAGPVDSSTYVIGPDDQIQVTVWNNPLLSGPLTVRPDGKISVSSLHDIQAAGLTPTQLADAIAKGLTTTYFKDEPTVDVIVLAVKSKYIYMLGEVNHVGPVSMAPGMSVLQAIASAGGLTPYANKKKAYILRGDPAHQRQIHFDYKKMQKGDMQGIALEPGDTIVFPD